MSIKEPPNVNRPEKTHRWDGGDKGHPRYWWREVSNQELAEEKAFLASVHPQFEQQAVFETRNARNRFKMV